MFETLRNAWAMSKLKTDEWGFTVGSSAAVIVGVVVCVVLAIALLTTVTKFSYDAQNNITVKAFTGVLGLIPITPLLYMLGVAILPVALIFAVLHEA